MRDFYERFYVAVASSHAHARFCERSFGQDLSQHGFADMEQVDALIRVTGLGPAHRALDLGCGNGRIAEYLSDRTGAHVTGLDYVPSAIQQARERTAGMADRLSFDVADINVLELRDATFDVILSIDTLYFSDDYGRTIGQLAAALRPGGQMAMLFSHGWEPWMSPGQFDAGTLPPDRTPLAKALQANGLQFRAQDWTAADCRLARLRKQILQDLRFQFELEGLDFIYANRLGEAEGIAKACALGLQRRYLYHVLCPGEGG